MLARYAVVSVFVAVAVMTGLVRSTVHTKEAGDPSVSIDLVIRALLAIGVRPKRIAEALV